MFEDDNRLLCLASERGKIIVNKCIDKKIKVNTLRLEKLLILVHGNMLYRYDRPFFKEFVVTYGRGLMIEEVDKDFLSCAAGFNSKFPEYITLLDSEENVVDEVINIYANLDTSVLNNLPSLRLLEESFGVVNTKSIVPNYAIKKVFNNSYGGRL